MKAKKLLFVFGLVAAISVSVFSGNLTYANWVPPKNPGGGGIDPDHEACLAQCDGILNACYDLRAQCDGACWYGTEPGDEDPTACLAGCEAFENFCKPIGENLYLQCADNCDYAYGY